MATGSERAVRAIVLPLIHGFVTRHKLALSRRGAGVARVDRNFSFLNFGVHGFPGGALLARPSDSTGGHFYSGVHGIVRDGGATGRRSLVGVLGPVVAN